LDFVLGLLCYPVVDCLPHCVGVVDEVSLVDVGLILVRGGLYKRRQEMKADLGSYRIGEVQLDTIRLLIRSKFALELSERRSELRLIRAEPQDLGHLSRGIAARTRVGHRQAG
jgi:hypothetical protein